MSIRATYLIQNTCNDNNTCFYIHSDNHPKGAVYYFTLMHRIQRPNIGFVAKFLLGISNADLRVNLLENLVQIINSH